MEKQTRRKSPNRIAQSKLFSNQGVLFIAKDFAKYELEQQALREGIYLHEDDRNIIVENWHILEQLFDLPKMPDDDGTRTDWRITEEDEALFAKMDQVSHALDLYGVCKELHAIQNVYDVICSSIDLELVKSVQIKDVLHRKNGADAQETLLTPDQFRLVGSLCSASWNWREEDEDHANRSNLWEVLLSAQQELNETGELAADSRAKLEAALASRAGAKRQRLYGPAAYIVLLAEFYEENHYQGKPATLHADKTQVTRRQHIHDELAKGDGKIAPWVRHYPSAFGKFLNDVMGAEKLQDIGKANAEKFLKNRKWLGKRKISEILKGGTKDDFVAFIEAVDLIKP
jgi:hypothetical protein